MRILVVTPMLPFPQAVNAGPLVMYRHLTALAARHEVTLASFAGPDPCEWEALDGLRSSGIQVRAVWRQAPSPLLRRWMPLAAIAPLPDPSDWGRSVKFLPRTNGVLPAPPPLAQLKRRLQQVDYWLHAKYPLHVLRFWEPQMQQLLDELSSEKVFDLIHIEDNALGSYRYDVRIPRVLTEHEVRLLPPESRLGQTSWIEAELEKAERRRWEYYQPNVWRGFDCIQVFTPHDAHAIASLAPDMQERVRVNPFGIDLSKQADARLEDSRMLVFVGGFCHLPNVDAALWLVNEIMPRIRSIVPGVRLTIVGSYPPPAVRAFAGNDIIVTGRVPAVEPYLERAAVVVAPVRAGGGMRLKVLQAMALGKAVVTTPLGAEGLAAGTQSPPLAIAEDSQGIADSTAALLNALEDRRELGRRARAFVAEHFSWSAYTERLEAIYSYVTNSRRSARLT